ncbi:MAG: 50S ribosomal protein L24 [Cyclobacteriaceae bacterium]
MDRKNNQQPKLHIRKGDTVKVLAGDDKGKQGKVLEVDREKRRALVEGVKMMTKHTKPSAGKPEGGISKVESFIHISNLMLIDPASGNATRVGRKLNDKGKLQRFSKKTGEIIK